MFKSGLAPHIRVKMTVERTMYEVIFALVPIILFAIYSFGIRVLYHLLIANIVAVLTEFIFQRLLRKESQTYLDGSSFLAVTLLVLTLSHSTSYFISAIGAFICILIGKITFGGLGTNIFNPALFTRVLLSIIFPAQIFTYKIFDLTAGATLIPLIKYQGLDSIKDGVGGNLEFFKSLFLGFERLGSMGETSIVLIVLGAIFLIVRKHILPIVPILIILSTGLFGYIFGHDPLVYISYGGVLFAAVFMATDMVTSPYTKKALALYAVLIGLITTIIREFTPQMEGITLAILIMNFAAPFLDEIFQSRVYGTKKNKDEMRYILLILIFLVFPIFIFNNYKTDEKTENKLLKFRREKVKSEMMGDMRVGEKIVSESGYTFTELYLEDENKLYYSEIKSKGYSKEKIYYALLINSDAEIVDFRIISHNETKGLGSQIDRKEWQNLWIGRDEFYTFDKEIDGFAGATFTSYNLYKSIESVLSSFSEDILSEEETWDDEDESWDDEELEEW